MINVVGRIITARQAVTQYPGKAKVDKGKIRLRDADCQETTVSGDQEVYHRGHGCFGIVTDNLDRGRHWTWGARKPGSRNRQKDTSGLFMSSEDIYGF